MTFSTFVIDEPRFKELDHREANGIAVSLLWNRTNDSLSVFVFDRKLDQPLEILVAKEHALDAFRHPYAYAAFQGLAITPLQPERDFSLHW